MAADDLRTAIAKAIAGPGVAEAFGRRRVDLRAGQQMPPDGCGPWVHGAIQDAYRHADAVLGVLTERGLVAGGLQRRAVVAVDQLVVEPGGEMAELVTEEQYREAWQRFPFEMRQTVDDGQVRYWLPKASHDLLADGA